jgi:hypothetical protein
MAGRIADELREIYRNLDQRPQIIPVPMPQVVVPQGRPAVAAGEAGVPPGLEIAGIPRYAREEELPGEAGTEAGPEEQDWDDAFAGLEPLPDEPEGAGEAPQNRREAGSERRVGPPDRREGSPDRREDRPDRREGPPDRRAAAGGQPGDTRQQLKDYLAKVREKLGAPAAPGMAEKPAEERPAAAKPAEEQPVAEKPAKERPAAEKPATEQLAAQKPVAEQPAAERPVAEKPATEQPAAEQPSAEGPLALLEELGEYLPKRQPERRKKNVFMRSDARMKLDYLKSRLEGHKGIMQKIQESYGPGPSAGAVTLQKVADAFIFIKDLAGYYPDRSVGTMMQSKVDSILRRIKR